MGRTTTVQMVTAIAAGLAILAPSWTAFARPPYTSPERDFSVAFPAAPKIDAHPAQNQDASAYWIYSAERHGGAFLVRVDQYPAGIPVPEPTRRIYELLLGAHAKESSSRLISIQSVPLGAFPSLQGVFTDDTGAIEKRRVVMAGHRLYQIFYTHAERTEVSAVGDAFLASFQIPGR